MYAFDGMKPFAGILGLTGPLGLLAYLALYIVGEQLWYTYQDRLTAIHVSYIFVIASMDVETPG